MFAFTYSLSRHQHYIFHASELDWNEWLAKTANVWHCARSTVTTWRQSIFRCTSVWKMSRRKQFASYSFPVFHSHSTAKPTLYEWEHTKIRVGCHRKTSACQHPGHFIPVRRKREGCFGNNLSIGSATLPLSGAIPKKYIFFHRRKFQKYLLYHRRRRGSARIELAESARNARQITNWSSVESISTCKHIGTNRSILIIVFRSSAIVHRVWNFRL